MQKKNDIKVGMVYTSNQGCDFTVIEYKGCYEVLIEFNDKHKHRAVVQAGNIRKGCIKNPFHPFVLGVGYMGIGKYVAKSKAFESIEYIAWFQMLRRCYDKAHTDKYPTYQGCTVCDEWHNFQVFAEWYTSQEHYGLGYDLDKDILIDGNKVYSPSTCVLAPHEINAIFTQDSSKIGNCPRGITYHKGIGKFVARLSVDSKRQSLGVFDNVDDALLVYNNAKKEYLKKKAVDWKDRIDKRLFDALMRKSA